MGRESKTLRIAVSGLVFFVLCQLTTALFSLKTVICNTGVGFGINMPVFLFVPVFILSILFLGMLIRHVITRQPDSVLPFWGGALLLGGALSNIVDRILRGCVPDFFHISFFPAFNLADFGISLGSAIILLAILKDPS